MTGAVCSSSQVSDWPSLKDPASDQLVLRDGSVAVVRPATPDDQPALRRFFLAMSAESRRRRFMGTGEPPGELLAEFCDASDPSRYFTLLGCRADGDTMRPIAIASYAAVDRQTAEVAFAVADGLHGVGIGTALLERLAAIAVRHGFTRFRASAFADNAEMLDVFRASGLDMHSSAAAGEVHVDLSLVLSPRGTAAMDERNRLATVASLRRILRPRSVAVVGVSRDGANLGRRVFDRIKRGGFSGALYAVNPNAADVAGDRCYASVRDLPPGVDLAIVATPADRVLQVVDDCAAAHIMSLVVITAGFAEVGEAGRVRQRTLLEKTRAYGMRIVGPNCMGVLNTSPNVRLNASFVENLPSPGRVAITSQSGGVGLALLELARARQLGVSTFVSLGNKADVSGNDLLQWGECDPETSVLLVYLESFGNPRRFAQLARRIGRIKPIVVVKAGRTSAGSRAASSHTAALASNEAAVAALFTQSGVIRAETIDEMFDIAQCLDLQPLPPGARVGIVTNTGGPGILAADACEAAGLRVQPFDPATAGQLAFGLSVNASVSNPVDLVASGGPAHYEHAIVTLLPSEEIDSLLVLYTPIDPAETSGILEGIGRAVAKARAAGGQNKPVVVCTVSAAMPPTPIAAGEERLPTYAFPENAALALGRATRYARWRQEPPSSFPVIEGLQVAEARALCQNVVAARGDTWLTGDELRRLFEAFGLPLVAEQIVRTADDAVSAATVVGYPVVLKVQTPRVLHKSETGGVAVNLATEQAVRTTFATMAERFPEARNPGSDTTIRVQPMLAGVETLVGVATDPIFGPLIAFGLGGVATELVHDVAFRMAPMTEKDVDGLLHEVRTFPLLAGFRGRPIADVPALREVVTRVAMLAHEVLELRELDLNPVIVLPLGEGCRIVDARARVARGWGRG